MSDATQPESPRARGWLLTSVCRPSSRQAALPARLLDGVPQTQAGLSERLELVKFPSVRKCVPDALSSAMAAALAGCGPVRGDARAEIGAWRLAIEALREDAQAVLPQVGLRSEITTESGPHRPAAGAELTAAGRGQVTLPG